MIFFLGRLFNYGLAKKVNRGIPKILKRENDFLDHDSYVDCAQIFSIDVPKFYENINRGVFVPIGILNNLAMAAVLRAGQTCRTLKKFEQEYFK